MRYIKLFNLTLKTLPLCFFTITLFGQNDSIRVVAKDTSVNQIAPSQIKVDSFTFIIDSIQVSGIKYGNTIETKSFFKESKTTLTTSFYLKDGKMNFVKVVEPSTINEKMYRYCDFYYKNDEVISQRCRSTHQIGAAIRVGENEDDRYRYNKNLTWNFLKTYVSILFNRVQNYR